MPQFEARVSILQTPPGVLTHSTGPEQNSIDGSAGLARVFSDAFG
jgi:hypothetical protein